jgi:glycerophosphoryl diester phosphodiesterase
LLLSKRDAVRLRLKKVLFSDLNDEVVPEDIARFSWLLDLWRGETLNVLAHTSEESAALSLAKYAEHDGVTIWISSNNKDLLLALRAAHPTIKLVYVTQQTTFTRGAEYVAASLRDEQIDAIQLHHNEWTGGLTTLFHRFTRCCFASELQQDFQFENLLRMGIDGISSKWVDRMNDEMRNEYGSI